MAINSVGNSNFLLGQSIVVWRENEKPPPGVEASGGTLP